MGFGSGPGWGFGRLTPELYAAGPIDSHSAFTTGDLSFFFSVHTPTRNICSFGSTSSTLSDDRKGL